MSEQQNTKCFLCNSTKTHFSKWKNRFTWYNYNGAKICDVCYYRDYRKKLKEKTFQSYKEKIGLRNCSKCGTQNTITTITKSGYPHRKWVSDGKGGYLCHGCTKKIKYAERERAYGIKRMTSADPRKLWAQMCMGNHKRNGFTMILTRHELAEMALKTDKCAICDVTLEWGYLTGKFQRNSPSLDRIDNEQIITKDNVQILCSYCNRTKLARTMSEFIAYCKYVAKKFD